MGVFDSNQLKDAASGREPRPSWNTPADPATDELAEQLSALGMGDPSKGGLFQVMKAMEDAESTIKQQLDENNHLREQLLWRTRELEKYKLESVTRRASADDLIDEPSMGMYEAHANNSSMENEADKVKLMDHRFSTNSDGLVVPRDGIRGSDGPFLQPNLRIHQYSEGKKVNGNLKVSAGLQNGPDNQSQFSTPSSRSISPTRSHRREGEYDPRGHGLVSVSEMNSNALWKQDLIIKVREHEEEISLLRKHLADYSMKDAQMRNEKYVLEKRIAYMRMAFDQQQQDLVDAASKSLSYRQDIIEENIHLTYALQAAQQEKTTFVSSLVPLLSEYGLQPSILDAQSIVSNLKVLFRHLQEKLIITEQEKLKDSQYQLTPWHLEPTNDRNLPPLSPSHPLGASLVTSSKGLEIVPQPTFSHAQSPGFSPADRTRSKDWEGLGNYNQHAIPSSTTTKNVDHNNLEGNILSVNRNVAQDMPAHLNKGYPQVVHFGGESRNQNPSFKELARSNETDDSEATNVHQGREHVVTWAPANSPYLSSGLDDPNSSYPYLPPVLEEPSSSFSEAAEDDPLPAIEGLQISGEAFPGRELQAGGYSINGTTSCNFEWVRYLEDGSVNYIEGAKQPKYLVTADDVDSYLAIEVHPLDDRKRKGELVKVFANEQRKITCDPVMQEQIEKTLSAGHASYEVALSARYLDIWEQAVLAIKREGYSIKCNGPRGVVVTEKFLPTTTITIPCGHVTEFSIQCSNGAEYLLRARDSWLRDTVVLTMRLFKKMAVEKRKGRKKHLFFRSTG
ncbi:uncharacterized protein LOC110024098 isoform X2 [Phalaenopsis equestris]|uniref:uncharacterized protein LOC110024098 isoform X2 n=1 Tax=Phalaenopsis equestris TaxID=78828 RepID=UPI0009E19ACE|nr:uncharacterized protein LOC110024098 isoform X2 [Phalaenopsis equestris]XP_020579507.1 uncharacterized protein LOC110024098 isoform X2 [Phalaenopsis equestris]XP_020579508.1 uncharacterized protein LOC110024098 isoform X2 [Phalaenopsis equestris]